MGENELILSHRIRNTSMPSLQPNWFDRLFARLKRALGFQVDRPIIEIIEEYHADGISVLRLNDPTIPGCCDFWRIDRQREGVKFFVCVLSVAQLRQDLAALGGSDVQAKAIAIASKGQTAQQVQRQIKEQSWVDSTHYWITGWNKEYSSVDGRGRAYKSHRTTDTQLLAVDLQGAAGSFAGNRHAQRFARRIIKQLSANDFREFHHQRTWTIAVKIINWADWLEGLSQSKNGIAPNHVLQPRKPDRRRIGDIHRLN